MSDFRKQGARALQDAFTVGDLMPSYTFCLNLWNAQFNTARAKGGMQVWKAAMIAEVIDLARPHVRMPSPSRTP